jgi:hypothetical protein
LDSSQLSIICLTPVKNEEWILERFLKATSLWADHIIIADQQSTDNSREIARRFKKVILIENPGKEYHEYNRQQILLDKAREIPGKKLLVALDADEFFTANIFTSPEWQSVINAEPGTMIRTSWVHILPRFWEASEDTRFDHFTGYMDNGDELITQGAIHNARLPIPQNGYQIFLNSIKLLHYSEVDSERNRSRRRWYMCWEMLDGKLSPFQINRTYSYHATEHPFPFPQDWIRKYGEEGIDMTSVWKSSEHYLTPEHHWKLETNYWWDLEVLNMMKKHGTKKFSKLDIWDKDWDSLGKRMFPDSTDFKRKASFKTRRILRIMRRHSPYQNNFFVRWLNYFLARIF